MTEQADDRTPRPGERVSRPAVNRQSSFGGGNRSAGLAGLLPPPVPPASTPPDAGQQTASPGPDQHAVEEPADPKPQRTRAAGAARKTAKRPARRAPVRTNAATPARLPKSLQNRLRRYARRTGGRGYAEVLLEAFERFHTSIGDLFTAKPVPTVPVLPAEGRLFPPRPTQAARDEDDEGTTQVNFTLTTTERDIIEDLVEQHPSVPNRTALIVAVLRRHLDDVEPAQPEDLPTTRTALG